MRPLVSLSGVKDAAVRAPEEIDVCVCTFRRASVAQTIRSLADQLGPSKRLIVIDNDEQPTSHALVRGVCEDAGVPVRFVHAPAHNISVARNAALDAATAPLMAFIDDDETASADWLDRLQEHMETTGADVVFGSVRALYPTDAPAWLKRADLHSIQAVVGADGLVSTGYCCNVLMRRRALGETRFRLDLGRSGGEDTVFFHQVGRAGRRMVWCAEALTFETAAGGRACLTWLLKRFFRSGQTHALTVMEDGHSRAAAAALAAAKALFCAGTALLTLWSPTAWRRALVRGALHCGAVARYAGLADLKLY